MSDNDKCPTCGIAREHDGPHYCKALKQAGKPMCPDPFHDPELGDIHDNTAPERTYLRVCRNPDEPFFWDADEPFESCPDPHCPGGPHDTYIKPVGDGEVVVRLTREEAQVLVGRAELALEETSWGYAALDESVPTPLSNKLRAALDQALDEQEAAMSDERPDKCPTCGSADPTDRPIVRRHDLHERQGNYLEPAHTPCPDRFHRPLSPEQEEEQK